MDKTLHITFAITGKDVDKLDAYTLFLQEIQSKGMDAKITSGNSNIYYTEDKSPKKEKNNG